MKRILLLIVLFSLFLNSNVFSEDIKVAVVPFFFRQIIHDCINKGVLVQDESLYIEVKDEINKYIEQKEGFVLSTKEFNFDDWISELSFLLEAIPNNREKFDADLFIWGLMSENYSKVDLEVVGIESSRKFSSLIDIEKVNNKNFAQLIVNAVEEGLNHADELMFVNADKIVDAYNSIVQYEILTTSDENILMNVDYDGLHEYIQNVQFLLGKNSKKEDISYTVITNQNKNLIILFQFADDKISNVQIDTDFRPTQNDEGKPTIFTVDSNDGHEIVFEFTWDRQNIKNVKIFPKMNPYHPPTI